MAVLTPLSDADARRVGAAFGLAVSRARGIMAGSVNSNFELALDDGGKVFARIYEEQTRAAAGDEARLLEHLASRGVPTPRPLRALDGGFVAEHAGKPVAIFPWIEGEMRCQRAVDAAAAREIGAALAGIHVAGQSFTAKPSRFGSPELAARLESVARQGDLPIDVAAALPMLAARLARCDGAAARSDGVIHGDLFRDNVLWKGDRIEALLDFESASAGSYPFDLMVTALAWCTFDRFETAIARAMVEGYVSVRPLLADEIERIHAEACFAALRFTITRITDYELRPRGKGVFKDYRRFLARLSDLEALGDAGLRTALGLGHSPARP
jgi:homoserine kinase type II